jgi:hypothetical protein
MWADIVDEDGCTRQGERSSEYFYEQIQGPLTPSGGDVQLGTKLRNGAIVYIKGKSARKAR